MESEKFHWVRHCHSFQTGLSIGNTDKITQSYFETLRQSERETKILLIDREGQRHTESDNTQTYTHTQTQKSNYHDIVTGNWWVYYCAITHIVLPSSLFLLLFFSASSTALGLFNGSFNCSLFSHARIGALEWSAVVVFSCLPTWEE